MSETNDQAAEEGVGGVNIAKTNNNNNDDSNKNLLDSLGGFFGSGGKGGTEVVDTCSDILSLLNGIDENLKEILEREEEEKEKEEKEPKKDDGEKGDDDDECTRFFAARLSRIRFLLYDERRQSSSASSSFQHPAMAEMTVQGMVSDEHRQLMPRLLENLHILEFESRKHVAAIFNYLMVCGFVDGSSDTLVYVPAMSVFRDYVTMNFDDVMMSLVRGHYRAASMDGASKDAKAVGITAAPTEVLPDVGLHCGSMFRSICRHASLYEQLVCTTERVRLYIFPFLDHFVHVPDFDVSSDAMESVRFIFSPQGTVQISPQQQQLIQMHPSFQQQLQEEQIGQQRIAQMIAEFLVRDYEEIFNQRFNPKLLSPKSSTATYMTRRVALQILSSVLLTRSNYHIMINYVAERSNLKLVLLLLRDKSPHLTLDAFNVFKVFVANPNKPPDVIKMLTDNRVKLCRYLQTLHQDREVSDIQFREEKKLIIATIEALS